jgi:hypothetical protein
MFWVQIFTGLIPFILHSRNRAYLTLSCPAVSTVFLPGAQKLIYPSKYVFRFILYLYVFIYLSTFATVISSVHEGMNEKVKPSKEVIS